MTRKSSIQDHRKDNLHTLTVNGAALCELGSLLDDAVRNELPGALASVPGEAGQPKAYLQYIFLNQS